MANSTKTPKAKTPKAKTPKAKTPKAKTPKAKTPKAKTPKAKTKTTKAKATKAKVGTKKADKLNETGKRKGTDRRTTKTGAAAKASAPVVERRKTKRRRQIDPTTCEREYSELEIEFMQAMDEYKRASGRMFPTCSEILEVLTNLGYRQVADPQAIYSPKSDKTSSEAESQDELEQELESDFA